jgi:hypothetical protein
MKLYALLIGINQYGKGNDLNGCINDVEDVDRYLIESFKNNHQIKKLCNHDATRVNIIEAFETHFQQMQDGDIAFVYYSGHGDTFTKPDSIYDPNNNTELQSWVCYYEDERCDLADKEVGVLINLITNDKNVQCVVVTDCCHSGTSTKNGNRSSRNFIKQNGSGYQHISVENYYGFSRENTNANGQYIFEAGKHIHIAACLDDQKSLEDEINIMENYGVGKEIKIRGLFTYNLIELLRRYKGAIGYANLVEQAGLALQLKNINQGPLLNNNTDDATAGHCQFLGNINLQYNVPSVINYINAEWYVNKGLMDNIALNDYLLLNNGDSNRRADAKIVEVYLQSAKLRTLNTRIQSNYRNRQNTPVLVHKKNEYFVSIGFDDAVRDDTKNVIANSQYFNTSAYCGFSSDANFSYIVKQEGNALLFCFGNTPTSIITGDINDVDVFLINILKYSKATYLWQLKETDTSLTNAYKIEVYKKDSTEVDFREHLFINDEIDFKYNQTARCPQLRIKITNTGKNVLKINTLYIDCMYGINNTVFNQLEITPHNEAYLYVNGVTYLPEVIDLMIEDSVIDNWAAQNTSELLIVSEQIKLFIATEQIGADKANPILAGRGNTNWAIENIVVRLEHE